VINAKDDHGLFLSDIDPIDDDVRQAGYDEIAYTAAS